VSEDFEKVRSKVYIARLTWVPEVKHVADELDKKGMIYILKASFFITYFRRSIPLER
jgi:hypothetical protein